MFTFTIVYINPRGKFSASETLSGVIFYMDPYIYILDNKKHPGAQKTIKDTYLIMKGKELMKVNFILQ